MEGINDLGHEQSFLQRRRHRRNDASARVDERAGNSNNEGCGEDATPRDHS